MPSFNPDASAMLIWLAPGITATKKDFQGISQSWTLEEAAEQAHEASKDHSKLPWIMTEDRILDQSGIAQLMSGLRAMKRFDRR